jgi:hypothetical protein
MSNKYEELSALIKERRELCERYRRYYRAEDRERMMMLDNVLNDRSIELYEYVTELEQMVAAKEKA